MNKTDVTIVRIYLAEGRDPVSQILKKLEKSGAGGFTVFRGLVGLGSDHKLHKASLLDLSAALPIVVEFFDSPERAEQIIEELKGLVKADRVISWAAQSGM